MAPRPTSFINQSSVVWYRSEFDERIFMAFDNHHKMMVASSLTHTQTHRSLRHFLINSHISNTSMNTLLRQKYVHVNTRYWKKFQLEKKGLTDDDDNNDGEWYKN